jgi:hypothetical protein
MTKDELHLEAMLNDIETALASDAIAAKDGCLRMVRRNLREDFQPPGFVGVVDRLRSMSQSDRRRVLHYLLWNALAPEHDREITLALADSLKAAALRASPYSLKPRSSEALAVDAIATVQQIARDIKDSPTSLKKSCLESLCACLKPGDDAIAIDAALNLAFAAAVGEASPCPYSKARRPPHCAMPANSSPPSKLKPPKIVPKPSPKSKGLRAKKPSGL